MASRLLPPPARSRRLPRHTAVGPRTGGFAAKEGSVAHICESPRGKGCRNVRPTVGKDVESRRKEHGRYGRKPAMHRAPRRGEERKGGR